MQAHIICSNFSSTQEITPISELVHGGVDQKRDSLDEKRFSNLDEELCQQCESNFHRRSKAKIFAIARKVRTSKWRRKFLHNSGGSILCASIDFTHKCSTQEFKNLMYSCYFFNKSD